MNNKPVTSSIIVCDDHIAIRAGITRILEEEQFNVVGECDTVAELLELVSLHPDAIVIADLGVDDVPFPNLMEKLREKSSACQIVVYSMREAPATIGLCYSAGAAAFVPKRESLDEIINAVKHAGMGERYFPRSVASELARFSIDRNGPANILSARELEILTGYAKEETLETLAARLGISERTVNNLLSLIAKKLNTPRSTLFHVARRHGLIDDH